MSATITVCEINAKKHIRSAHAAATTARGPVTGHRHTGSPEIPANKSITTCIQTTVGIIIFTYNRT